MNAVQKTVATPILRQLSGYRGYPKPLGSEGESRFIDVLCEVSISVDHALAIIAVFDGEFPTVREIRDVALKIKETMQPSADQRAEWEKQYGPPQAFDISPALKERKGREIDRLWDEVLHFLRSTKFDGRGDIQKVAIGRCWQIAKHLGYKMNSYQQAEIDAYEHAYPQSRGSLPVKPKAITEADFKALAGGEDPNRWE